MTWRPLALALVLVGCAHAPRVVEPVRGRAFWLSLRDTKFALPAGETREAVLRDAESLVESEDPVLRDDVGYGLVVAWIYQQHAVAPPSVIEFATHLQRRLEQREGPVLGRSFSALSLSIIAAAELKQPVLPAAQFEALVGAATDELVLETDLRGHDPVLGWIHATAHTADLLKFLARDDRLEAAQQARITNAVVQRLSHGPAFTWGEDERLAGVFRSLLMRKDAHPEVFVLWLGTLGPAWAALWKAPVLDAEAYAQLGNVKQTLRALYALLSASEASAELDAIRARLLATLLELQ